MLFNSPEFAVFFVVVLAAYRLLGRRYRLQDLLLLAASFLFYGWWDVRFLYLAIISCVLDYYCALMIDVGRVPLASRLGGALYLVLAAFLLVTVQWDAVALAGSGLHRTASVDWGRLLGGGAFGWPVFWGTLAAVVAVQLAYPALARLPEGRRRRIFIAASVGGQLTILGFFKYFNFFAETFRALAEHAFGVTPGPLTLDVVLPVGISFYTFQTMSYTIDVYRREMRACRSLFEFSTFVMFFPQLVAGPIERAAHMLPQFQRPRPPLTGPAFREGTWLIAWGLYKKMVVADNLALLVNATFGPFDAAGSAAGVPADGMRLLVAVYAFAFQIYGDFSGYSDIARGTAKLLGFDLMLNFDQPYFATSPSSFWRRWHISLSTWLRDYLYISLGGNRGGPLRMYRNLILTMLLGGLWHGASWTFVLWGLYHGLLLVAYRAAGVRTERGGYPRWALVLMGVLMFHLTCFGWLLFRAQDVATVGLFLQSIVLHPHWSPEALARLRELIFYGWFLAAFEVVQAASGTPAPLPRWHWALRLNVWMMVLMSMLALTPSTPSSFIYFAF